MEQRFNLILPHEEEKLWQNKKELLLNVSNKQKDNNLTLALLENYYSKAYNEQITLSNLQIYCNNLNKNESELFWEKILPFISNSALKIESLFEKSRIKILNQQFDGSNILTKEQICCLLANMFFFTIDHQKNSSSYLQFLNKQSNILKDGCKSEQSNNDIKPLQLPSYVNMKNILTKVEGQFENQCNIQKIYCIINYFKRMMLSSIEEQQLRVIYKRQQFKDPNLINSLREEQPLKLNEVHFKQMKIDGQSGIQDYEDQFECIQSDFADKYVGGGVLNKGCVQEEIMYIVSIELIPSILFCERLSDNEVLHVSGAERYCTYKGYGPTFQYEDNYISKAEVDKDLKIKLTHYTVFDAINFRNREKDQYQWDLILRDLTKSYCAFQHLGDNLTQYLKDIDYGQDLIKINESKQIQTQLKNQGNKNLPIITGNWGCGLYSGDVQLKLIIQWISASLLQKNVFYCTFGNLLLNNALEIISIIQGQSISKIIKILKEYILSNQQADLFSYILANKKVFF